MYLSIITSVIFLATACYAQTDVSNMIKAGDILRADLEPKQGQEMGKTRPVVIVQNDAITALNLETVVVAPLSTNLDKRAIEQLGIILPRIKARDDLPYDSVILPDQLRSISVYRFVQPVKILTTLSILEKKMLRETIDRIL